MATLLNTLTGLTITEYPAAELPDGYYLEPVPQRASPSGLWTSEFFEIRIRSSSLANLETAIAAFMKCGSLDPAGYRWSTATYPLYIEMQLIRKDWDSTEFYGQIQIEGRWDL